MDEYIKREDAMKALDEYRLSHTMSMHGDLELLIEFRDGVIGAMNAIKDVPTADVVDVVRCKDCKNRLVPVRCALWYGTYGDNNYFCERGMISFALTEKGRNDMGRYAEWNKFIGNLKTDKYGETTVNEVGIAFEKATADVVPKSEVERLEREVETLKDNNEHLAVLLAEEKAEVARLQKEMENTNHA